MQNNDLHNFGNLLKYFRKRKKLTQQQLAEALATHRNTISRWELGDFYPDNKRIVLDLAKCLHLNDQETRQLLEASLTAVSPYWSLPYPRNPFFTGREEILHQIHTTLAIKESAVSGQTSALSGLGGIGKTQTTIEYAYRYVNEYTAVLWISAENAESILSSISTIAYHLNLPEKQAQDQSQTINSVLHWLSTHEEWLLILDNVEDIELIRNFLPAARRGSLLLTTRRQALGIASHIFNLEVMTPEEGSQFLLKRSRRFNTPTPEMTYQQALGLKQSIVQDTNTLVKLLEGLPLALDQAGAYLEETGCTIAEYIQLYNSQRKNLLAHRGTYGGIHPESVSTTLTLSVQKVEQEHPEAAKLLRLCTFLHPDAIPEELIIAGGSHLEPTLTSLTSNPYQFDLAVAALRNSSLISRYPGTRMLSIHRLVQAVLQDQMDTSNAIIFMKQVICMINAAFPHGAEKENWPLCERYLTQALACVPLIKNINMYLPEAGTLLYKVCTYFMTRGHYTKAEPLINLAIDHEKQYNEDQNPYVLISYWLKLGELHWHLGKYKLAKKVLVDTQAYIQQHLGPTHLQMGEAINLLALVFWSTANYQEAEQLFLQALSIEHLHNREHPHTTHIIHNLAMLYRDRGDYEQAEQLLRQVLSLRENSNSEPPEITYTLNGLANVYRSLGRYQEAEKLYRKALSIQEQHFGDEHPLLAWSYTGLGYIYAHYYGDYKQAELLYQRALILQKEYIKDDNPDLITVYNWLANLYRDTGKFEQAERFYRQGLSICTQLDASHPHTVSIRNDYQYFLESRNYQKTNG